MESQRLPEYFKPILWSYDFSNIEVDKDRKTIIIHTINYGDLKHLRWISDFYGKKLIIEVLKNIPITEIRTRAVALTSLLFGIDNWNYAPRSTNR